MKLVGGLGRFLLSTQVTDRYLWLVVIRWFVLERMNCSSVSLQTVICDKTRFSHRFCLNNKLLANAAASPRQVAMTMEQTSHHHHLPQRPERECLCLPLSPAAPAPESDRVPDVYTAQKHNQNYWSDHTDQFDHVTTCRMKTGSHTDKAITTEETWHKDWNPVKVCGTLVNLVQGVSTKKCHSLMFDKTVSVRLSQGSFSSL